jgi:hypothetical protein
MHWSGAGWRRQRWRIEAVNRGHVFTSMQVPTQDVLVTVRTCSMRCTCSPGRGSCIHAATAAPAMSRPVLVA